MDNIFTVSWDFWTGTEWHRHVCGTWYRDRASAEKLLEILKQEDKDNGYKAFRRYRIEVAVLAAS